MAMAPDPAAPPKGCVRVSCVPGARGTSFLSRARVPSWAEPGFLTSCEVAPLPNLPEHSEGGRQSRGACEEGRADALRLSRRRFVAALSSAGISGGLFPGVLWARLQDRTTVTPAVIEEAEKVAGLSFSAAERELMVRRLLVNRSWMEELREVEIPDGIAPAFEFDPTPRGRAVPEGASALEVAEPATLPDPDDPTALAYASIAQLGALLRAGAVSSVRLTELYLERLQRFGPELQAVVTLTEELALEQARQADAELAGGRDRGPLHGIPWGAKDLLATRGYPTTWGAAPYRNQRIDRDATVVGLLAEAGAVLVAKLTLGALARGDQWYGGQTLNPWNPAEGSSGSSAGPAAATSAGLVGFSIGSETVGSIVSPSARCGASGLRPTFGRVSRFGAMPLVWTMDKLGPICRSAEDCAIVLAAIQGPDGLDRAVRDVPFVWASDRGTAGIRVGYLEAAFRAQAGEEENEISVLRSLSALGLGLQPLSFSPGLPVAAMRLIVSVEAASFFDALTRSGADDLLHEQGEVDWPNTFRAGRFIPAVEYVQASRVRMMLIEVLEEAWRDIDVVVTPSFAEDVVLATNLTGHPSVTVPSGYRRNGTPTSITFLGGLWKDAEVLTVAKAYQEATGHHSRRPPRFS